MSSALNNGDQPTHHIEEAYEVFGWPSYGPLVISCEHATNILPDSIKPDLDDHPWLQTHWAYDIGARDVALAIIQETRSAGVLSRFSRLVCDPNKSPDDNTVVRSKIEQHVLGFNELLSPELLRRRVERYHRPFHDAIDSLLRLRLPGGGDILLVAIHTFVPALYGLHHKLDVGVLFHPHQAVAMRLLEKLNEQGFTTALNEPRSGRRGQIYSASRHGLRNQVVFLELEINQALLTTPSLTAEVAKKISSTLMELQVRRTTR